MIRNSSDWPEMNSYPKVSPGEKEICITHENISRHSSERCGADLDLSRPSNLEALVSPRYGALSPV